MKIDSQIERLLDESQNAHRCAVTTDVNLRRKLRRRCESGELTMPYPQLFARKETWDALSIGACLVTFFVSFLSVLGGAISYCIAFVVAYARAWQIYVLAAFSAIPMALMGFEETKQMAIGFLKNFAAAVLAEQHGYRKPFENRQRR